MTKLKDLIQTCNVLHLNPIPTKNHINKYTGRREKTLSVSDCVKAIQRFYLEQRKINGTYHKSIEKILLLESPMLALLFKYKNQKEQDEIWDNDNTDWLWEEKLDGCRALICYDPVDGFDIYSRNLSAVDQLPFNYADNILWNLDIRELTVPFIIDCEIVPKNREVDKTGEFIPVADTQQGLILSILLLDPESSKRLQVKNPVKFVAFDILYLGDKPMLNMKLNDRKRYLHALLPYLVKAGVPIEEPLTLQYGQDKMSFYNAILNAGGEGVIAKHLDSKYDTSGKRDGAWVKIKRAKNQIIDDSIGDTVDAFVMGFDIGSDNKVSALTFGIILLDNTNQEILDESGDPLTHIIATVSDLTEELKDVITTKDIFGNTTLRHEMYGKVASLNCKNLSKGTLRFNEASLVIWRSDRSASTCRIRKDILEKSVL